MKVYGTDGKEMMAISSIERDGSMLVVKGKIFGAMPLSAKLKPSEVRSGLKLMGWRTLLFLITLPFRRD
jgi:hypothetical protein